MRAHLNATEKTVVLAHEEAVRLLQHVVLTYGGDLQRPCPASSEVALWLAALSDHLGQWAEPDVRPLTQAEELIAVQAHAFRFNNRADWLREIARSVEILRSRPTRNKLANEATWTEVQDAAFGTHFIDYAEAFLVPFAITARGWGIQPSPADPEYPGVKPSEFVAQLDANPALVRRWLDELSIDRPAVQSRLVQVPPALPHAPVSLLHRPLVRLDNAILLPSSPAAVLIQLKTGPWSRLRTATKKVLGTNDASIWTSTFGDLFEAWCVRVAQDAASSLFFRGQLIVPSAPGAPDEIEDVVVREGRAFVLFSVKARLVEENVARRAPSRSALIDWYDDFFFGPAKSKHRAGVLRQLSNRIDMIRAGKFEPCVPRKARLLPVLVTYDSMCEDVLLYQRIEEKCAREGVLTQAEIGPLTIARIDHYETLFARAARGESIVGILRKREKTWKHRRLDALLHYLEPHKPPRLELLSEAFKNLEERVLARLRKKQALSPTK